MLKIDRTLLAGTALALAMGMSAPLLAQQSNTAPPAGSSSSPAMNQSQTGMPSSSGSHGSAQSAQDSAVPGTSTAQGAGSQGMSGQPMAAMSEEELKGKDLYGADNQKVGEIDKVLMGPDNQANSVLVDIGGFLGIGAKTVAIPVAQLRAEGDRVVAQNLTKDQAKNMQEYKESDSKAGMGEKKM